jgi:hypothetical protein
MKKLALLLFTILFSLFVSPVRAQKTVYIPYEWRQNRTDTLLYKESDPDGKYTWSKTRSVESDNVIIFWDKFYKVPPHQLAKSDWNYVDIPDLLKKCEAFFELEINKLGFVDPNTSSLAKYKVMVLMNHSNPGDWACYGGGYDFMVSALWLNSATCKPVGLAVAHEVGHSFHYMCFAEHSGHNDSDSDNTGFHLACGNGQAIWEQTAQWQACQSYPEQMFDQSINVFHDSHNYAFSHEWHRYQSYWFHYYLCQYYNDITTVAQVWNTPMTGQSRGNGSDFNQALMKLKGLSVRDLFKLYFDYACRLATWDLDVCAPYRNPYVGYFTYRCVLTEDDKYQVALASCPQGTGFNVIPLKVPVAGTQVTTHLTGLSIGAALQDGDPGEYLNGDSQYEKASDRHYVNGGNRAARGFRMGYVALMQDGSRRYFSEDSVYCTGAKNGVTEDYAFTVPDGVKFLWLIVSPALKSYTAHKWDDKIDNDDMWPYSFSLEGTDIGDDATVYASPTLDGRPIADCSFVYDVSIPLQTQNYLGTTVRLNGRSVATLGTAFQMDATDLTSRMEDWGDRGPGNGKIMFYAVAADGSLEGIGSTANGYGHWFDATGKVCAYNNGYLYSEFSPKGPYFYIGQYPARLVEGRTYTIRQALRYRKNPREYAQATFTFNVTVGGTTTSSVLRSIDYNDPTTQGIEDLSAPTTRHTPHVFDLQGRRLMQPQRGLNIIDGKKVVME